MIVHPARRRRTAELSRLDPAIAWHEIYRRLALWELPAEARFGFQLAFYRPLAVPRMAAVLRETGHFQRDTTRRAYDTGIVVHEVIWGGVDSERGRRMVALMNRLHDRPDIRIDDMRYILNALIVVPTRFMDHWGWRRVTSAERTATWQFWNVLGDRMGISDRARSYAEAEQQFATFEAAEIGSSEAGHQLTRAVLDALRDRLPPPVRRLAGQVTNALIDDPLVSAALGLPALSMPMAAALRVGGQSRKLIERVSAPQTKPSFWPGRPAGRIYPEGYSLDDLGPRP